MTNCPLWLAIAIVVYLVIRRDSVILALLILTLPRKWVATAIKKASGKTLGL